MPTRILILGAGGREHALAWKLSAEPGVNEVIVGPGSEAMTDLPRVRRLAGLDPLDAAGVVAAARATAAELVVIGLRRRTAVGKFVLGSTSQRIILGADCPVLAVKADLD